MRLSIGIGFAHTMLERIPFIGVVVPPPVQPVATLIGTAVVTVTGLLGQLLGGTKTYTIVVPGIIQGEVVTVGPNYTPPPGWVVNSVTAVANNTVQLSITNPLLSLGATTALNIPLIVLR